MKTSIIIILFLLSYGVSASSVQGWFLAKIVRDGNLGNVVTHQVEHEDTYESTDLRLLKLDDIWSEGSNFKYLSYDERQSYKVTFRDGLILDSEGNDFDSSHAYAGQAMFVMDELGDIYITNKFERINFEHNSFMGGKSVICAGTMIIRSGRLERINDFSAQYVSLDRYPLTKVVSLLKKAGISFVDVRVVYNMDYK